MRGIPVAVVLALAVGIFAGYIDLHNNGTMMTLLILLAGMVLIGFISPDWWWLAAIISGLSLLATHVLQIAFGTSTWYATRPNSLASLLALMPAFIGGLAGAAIRKATQKSE